MILTDLHLMETTDFSKIMRQNNEEMQQSLENDGKAPKWDGTETMVKQIIVGLINESTKGSQTLQSNDSLIRFQCTYCNSNYAQKSNLYMHVKQRHEEYYENWKLSGPKLVSNFDSSSNNDVSKSYQCPYCESILPRKWSLKKHVKHQHMEKFDSFYVQSL